MHKNLAFNMGAVQLIFMLGADQTHNKVKWLNYNERLFRLNFWNLNYPKERKAVTIVLLNLAEHVAQTYCGVEELESK